MFVYKKYIKHVQIVNKYRYEKKITRISQLESRRMIYIRNRITICIKRKIIYAGNVYQKVIKDDRSWDVWIKVQRIFQPILKQTLKFKI